MIRTRGRRPLACHHEAGHAVARWWLGFHTDDAAVLTVKEMRAGATLQDRRGREVYNVEGMVTGYDIHFPLGREGVHASPETNRSWMARRTQMRAEMALVASAAGVYAEARYRRRSAAGCALSGGRGDYEHAQNIASTWFDGNDARFAAVERADELAAALVRSPMGWAAIQGVAAALFNRGRIDGDEVDALCSSAYGAPFSYDRWAEAWPPTSGQIRAGFLPMREPRRAA